jgi:hypothetical protein
MQNFSDEHLPTLQERARKWSKDRLSVPAMGVGSQNGPWRKNRSSPALVAAGLGSQPDES